MMMRVLFVALLLLVCRAAYANIAIDGSASTSTGSADTATVTLTTTQTNDIIVVYPACLSSSTSFSVSSISDGAGLTWTKRTSKLVANNVDYEEWYAVASSALSSDVITITYSLNCSAYRQTAIGVSGAKTSTPFDTNAAVPANNSVTTGTSVSLSLSTNNANDLLLTSLRCASAYGTLTRPTNFNSVLSLGTSTDLSDDIVSATISSVSEAYTFTSAATCAMLMDALQSATTPPATSKRARGFGG